MEKVSMTNASDLYIDRLKKQSAQRRDTIARLQEQLRLSQKRAAEYKRQLKKLVPLANQAQAQLECFHGLAIRALADALRETLDEIENEQADSSNHV